MGVNVMIGVKMFPPTVTFLFERKFNEKRKF